MRAQFSPAVIGELRYRVIQHNEALGGDDGRVKLGELKHLYKRWFGGRNPHLHALEKIDKHLEGLRTRLVKAQEPFDQGRHPRGQHGRFRPDGGPRHHGEAHGGGGSGGSGGGGGPMPPPTEPKRPPSPPDRPLARNGEDASVVQVIPETRYSTLGPPIAGLGGIAYGAYAGATATMGGTPIDRAITRGTTWAGGKTGILAGRGAAGVKHVGGRVARVGIGAVNRTLHTSYARPALDYGLDAATSDRLALRGQKIGAAAGRVVGHVQAIPGAAINMPAVVLRRGLARVIPGVRGRVLGSGAGAIYGAATTGALLAAPIFAHAMSEIGPYLDATFPRRVHKMIGPMWDAPEVLAKQAELTANDTLAKASIGPVLRYVASRSRNLVMRGARAFRTLTPGVASHTVGPAAIPIPHTIGGQAGQKAFQQAAKEGPFVARGAKERAIRGSFEVGRNRAGRAIDVASHTAMLGAGGAAAGAIGGAAGAGLINLFRPEQHPRDEHGRFERKDIAVHQAAKRGAQIGGAIGLGAGLLTGLAAARRGHTEVLRAAISRLTDATPGMTEAAENEARTVHARTFAGDGRNARRLRPFAPGEVVSHDRVVASLEGHAGNEFAASRRGSAMRATPQAWYYHQIESAFDARAKQVLSAVPGARPLVAHDGSRISQNSVNLVDNLDPTKLNARQRRVWDQLVKSRTDVRGAVDAAYDRRLGESSKLADEIAAKETERAKLDAELGGDMLAGARTLEETPATTATAIKQFAKRRLNVDLKGRTKDDLFSELKNEIDKWHDTANTRVDALEKEIETAKTELADKRQQTGGDLTELERTQIRNPFTTNRNDQYFDAKPDYAVELARVKTTASRSFLQDNNRAADEAKTIVGGLINQRRQSLEAGIPQTGFIGQQFEQHAPVLAAHLRQAMDDYRAIATARRDNAQGAAKWIYDQLHANKDPKKAYESAAKMAGWIEKHGSQVVNWAFRHWKPIFTTVSLGGAFGVVDLSQPAGGKMFKHPRNWRRPPTLQPVVEFPDPLNKPNEAVLGFSYKDRQTNQLRFLHGFHIYDKKGSHNAIPFGSSVDQVRNQLRNRAGGSGGGGGSRLGTVDLKLDQNDRQKLEAKLKDLRGQNNIKRDGYTFAPFHYRAGGNADGHDRRIFDGIARETSLKWSFRDTPRDRAVYYRALNSVFGAGNQDNNHASILDLAQKAHLLIGGGGLRRGIFGANNAYAPDPSQADKNRVVQALRRQIDDQGHGPANEEEFRVLGKAMWTVATHYGLNEGQKNTLQEAIRQQYERNGQPAPNAPESNTPGSRNRAARFGAEMADLYAKHRRLDEYQDDGDFRDATAKVYQEQFRLVQEREAGKEAGDQLTPEERHEEAARRARQIVNGELTKLQPEGGLRKYLVYGQTPHRARIPRIAGISGRTEAGKAPVPITTIRTPTGTGGLGTTSTRIAANPPAITGSTRPGNDPNLATRLGASHQLGQAGSYGLSTAAYEGLEGLSEAIPQMRAAGAVGRLALGIARPASGVMGRMVGSNLVNVGGTSLGRRLGRNIGDTGDTGAPRTAAEGDVRMGGGMLAGIAGQHAGKTIGRVGLRQAPGVIGHELRAAPGAVAGKIGGAARAVGGGIGRLFGRGAGTAGQAGANAAASSVGEGIAGAAARAAGKGTLEAAGERIGGTVGSGLGALGGEVAEPAGGGVAGRWIGHGLGAAIGAGAGWLADEGIGMLYHHLGNSYGPAAAHTAAKSLGVPAEQRRRHGAAIGGASQR